MAISIFETAMIKHMSVGVLIICILITYQNLMKKKDEHSWDLHPSFFLSMESESNPPIVSLEYDFYRDSCPQAEKIVQNVVRDLYKVKFSTSPALLRLAFHDCFIKGCDASILLDAVDGQKSEKDSRPNQNLKGFDIIDKIKSQIEQVCPGVVSCADIVVLAAREGIIQAGGPFYPLLTGRRDSPQSFANEATNELPSPYGDLSDTLASFASRGFDERETVSLLGGHSIGVIHCKFIQDRLYDFGGSHKPDSSLDSGFLYFLRSKCNQSLAPKQAASPTFDISVSSSSSSSTSPLSSSSAAPSLSFRGSLYSPPVLHTAASETSHLSSPEDPEINMAYEGPGVDFGTLYYRSLLQGRGILFSDQQLTSGEETGVWVRAYSSDMSLFRRDFSQAMMKLSSLQVLTGSVGQIRRNCSKVA